jgi:uncharacterized protein (TIGR02677 family)
MGADSMENVPDLSVFAYAVAEKSALYVDVVEALMAAKERFKLQLRPAEVGREMGSDVDADQIADALESLAGWGNVTKFYDTAAPETLDQFYSRRFLYQLTDVGVAAHEGVRAVRRCGLDTGRLSAVLLPGIIERLEAIRHESAEPDGARLYRLLVDLFGAFSELADNAGRYMNDLAVETSAIAGDDQSFHNYKRAVFAYLNEFVARLTDLVPRIGGLIETLDPVMTDLIRMAAETDTAPVRDGEDDGVRLSFEARWSGVRAWFVRNADEAPIAESLRLAMLDAINRILVAVTRLNERHLRRVTREADFMQLARWFAVAGTEEGARLWDRAFGLYGARHFAELAGDEEVERGESFWTSQPAEVAPRLRASGVRSGVGRAGRAADYSATKAARLAEIREQRRQAEIAIARLAGRTPVRLSHLGVLEVAEFAQFLIVVDAALNARPTPDGTRTASTPLVSVRLRPFPEPSLATVITPHGALTCDDHLLDIELAGTATLKRAAG